ncbi:TPA: efflux transporter periplasmic adaptor subunit, partial [Bacillus cereus]|nr:efflux transporter periplasmic adaptor subunit [Bacillus cereus]
MLSSNVQGSTKKKRRIIIGVITLFSIIIAINIFLIQGKKKENKKVDAVSLEKVTERKLNNT